MGDNKKQSNSAALVTCAACMLFTLVTCSFVLAQYFRWQDELMDLKVQIVKALPVCSPSGKDVDTVPEAMRNVASDEASVLESSSKEQGPRSNTFREPSSLHSRLRRSAEAKREGGRRQRGGRNKRNDTSREEHGPSNIHMIPTTQKPKNLRAIQFKLDADKYKDLTANNKTTILQWWNPEEWCQGHPSDLFDFNQSTGQLTILKDSLYYVYAQITYKNPSAMNSFDVKINNDKALISCTQERRFPEGSTPSTVVDNCHAASVARLSAGQTLSIWNAVSGSYFRRMDSSSGATFWGVMRIGHS